VSNPTTPEVSVLIPVRDGGELLREQLEALSRQTYPGRWEIVVVDNGSTDDTPAVLTEWSGRLPQLRVVSLEGTANASRARNAGAESARAPVLAFCDADDVVDPRWLQSLVAAIADADLVAGRLDVHALNDQQALFWRDFAMPSAGTTAFDHLPYAVSANMAVTRAAFDEVGGFDQSIPGPGSEEIDFCWRVQQAGHRFGCAPDAVIAYRFRTDLRGFVRQQLRYGRGEAALFARHRPSMRRDPFGSVLSALWFAVSRFHHVGRGAALRGRYLGYVAYRLGRIAGAAGARVAYW
jgi:glycosyltransferase involved in cell wall biosynthesis